MTTSFFREAGEGPGVVCFHSNCSSSGQFKSLMTALADSHHVFAVDSYGAGKTPAWDRPEHLSLADEVALAEPVMDRAGEGIVLVGHSYGAAVALTAALANPSRVKAIVVYEPTLFSLVNQVHPLPNGADAIRSAVQSSSEAVSKGDVVTAASVFIDFWSGEGTWDQTPERPKEAILLAIRDVARWGFALNNDPTPLSAFSQLTCPILYLLGSASPVPARAVADVLIPVLPNVQVLEFEGLGHMGPITHPTTVNDATVAFLNRIA